MSTVRSAYIDWQSATSAAITAISGVRSASSGQAARNTLVLAVYLVYIDDKGASYLSARRSYEIFLLAYIKENTTTAYSPPTPDILQDSYEVTLAALTSIATKANISMEAVNTSVASYWEAVVNAHDAYVKRIAQEALATDAATIRTDTYNSSISAASLALQVHGIAVQETDVAIKRA